MLTVKIMTLSSEHPVRKKIRLKLRKSQTAISSFFPIFVSHQTFVTFDLFQMEKRSFVLPDNQRYEIGGI